jgi:hypothetical protein
MPLIAADRRNLFRLVLISFAFALSALAFGCAGDDSGADDDQGDDSSPADDDGDHAWPVVDYLPPCAAPLDPPDPYHPREAAWFVARFDDESSPVLGVYAYFWLDWYTYEGCSWSSNWAVLYKNGGAIGDNFVAGEFQSGFDVDFGPGVFYDVFVHPLMHAHADPDHLLVRHLDLFADDFEAHFALRLRHVKLWTAKYFAAYDADIEDAAITVGGQTVHPTGVIDFERWFESGGYEPGSEDDNFIHGAWLYEPFSWRDESGARVSTLVVYWLETDGQKVWVQLAGGVLSTSGEEYQIASLDWDVDYPENAHSDGYLIRHAMHGSLADGREFSYEVQVVKQFHDYDTRPPAWVALLPPQERVAHSLTAGALQFDGATYDGGGVDEWRVTDYNPLPVAE